MLMIMNNRRENCSERLKPAMKVNKIVLRQKSEEYFNENVKVGE